MMYFIVFSFSVFICFSLTQHILFLLAFYPCVAVYIQWRCNGNLVYRCIVMLLCCVHTEWLSAVDLCTV